MAEEKDDSYSQRRFRPADDLGFSRLGLELQGKAVMGGGGVEVTIGILLYRSLTVPRLLYVWWVSALPFCYL